MLVHEKKMCRTRPKFDRKPCETSDEHIEPLINDDYFKPPVVDLLAGGINIEDEIGLYIYIFRKNSL